MGGGKGRVVVGVGGGDKGVGDGGNSCRGKEGWCKGGLEGK